VAQVRAVRGRGCGAHARATDPLTLDDAPAPAGKTAMALSIAASLRRKTLVLCNRSFLMHQWRHDVEGSAGWTWADDNTPVREQPPQDARRNRCDACSAWAYGSAAASPLAETCACGFRYVAPWCGAVAPREGWLSGARVGWLQGALPEPGRSSKTLDVEDKDVVIGSIDSVSQCAYPRSIMEQFGLVVVDEMHHLGALTLSQVLPQVPARYVLGISATPDRNDGLEHLLYFLAGPTCFVYKRLPSITGLRHTVHVTQLLFGGGAREEVVYRSGQLGYAAMGSKLAEDAARNALLVRVAQSALSRGRRKVLVVTSIVEHAKLLAAQLGGPQVRVALLHGGCSASTVALAKSDAVRLVVATFQYMEEGYDDATLDTLLMAMPRSSIQQVVGRCERTHAGKLVPEVWDVVDTFSLYEAMSWKRHAFYKSRGFAVQRLPA
jgi:superfamily II DNA or RNA helicase